MRLFLLLLSSLSASSLATTCFDQINLSSWHAVASTPRKSSSKHGCTINLYFDQRADETVFVDMLVRHSPSKNGCFAKTMYPKSNKAATTYPVTMISCRCSGDLCNNVNLIRDSVSDPDLPTELRMINYDLSYLIEQTMEEAEEIYRSMKVFNRVIAISLAVAVTANTIGLLVAFVTNYSD